MKITQKEKKRIVGLVNLYEEQKQMPSTFLGQLEHTFTTSSELDLFAHSIKSRLKDPKHLENKLIRKMIESKKQKKDYDITRENLFSKINDLVGIRILHLYTKQMSSIHRILLNLFDEHQYRLVEGPFARTWDDESREYFEGIGIQTEQSPSMYTSVHYVIEANQKTKYTGEIQVRTLMEEVCGEVNHAINYPENVNSLPCREQIKALARVTSSCSRLVDSIYASYDDYQKNERR